MRKAGRSIPDPMEVYRLPIHGRSHRLHWASGDTTEPSGTNLLLAVPSHNGMLSRRHHSSKLGSKQHSAEFETCVRHGVVFDDGQFWRSGKSSRKVHYHAPVHKMKIPTPCYPRSEYVLIFHRWEAISSWPARLRPTGLDTDCAQLSS